MKLSEEEITKHLLESAHALGEVRGLVSQVLEHYSSFNRDRKAENDNIWNALNKISDKYDQGQKESQKEIVRYVDGMNDKFKKSEETCDLKMKDIRQEMKKPIAVSNFLTSVWTFLLGIPMFGAVIAAIVEGVKQIAR